MKKPLNNVNDNELDIFGTVSIVDGDEAITRANDEYIYLEAIGGVVNQKEEVESIQNRQSIDVLKNQLLGQFSSETGKYEISQNVESELRQIVKVETNRKKNAIFVESLSSFGGLGKLKFVVTTEVKGNEAKSQLFLFEDVKKMAKTVTNTQIQLVADFKREDDLYNNFNSLTFDNYYKYAYEYFRIIKQNQIFYLTEDEKFLQGWIVRRKLYLKEMGKQIDPAIERAESGLLLERIEVLSGLGEYGYKVLEKFESLKGQAKGMVKKDFSARDQNEMLEEAIETYRGKYPAEQQKFFIEQVEPVRKYSETISTLKEKNHKKVLRDIEERMPTVVEVIKKEDEKRIEKAKTKQDIEQAQINKGVGQEYPVTLNRPVVERKIEVKAPVSQITPVQDKQIEPQQSVVQTIEEPSVQTSTPTVEPLETWIEKQKKKSIGEKIVGMAVASSIYNDIKNAQAQVNEQQNTEQVNKEQHVNDPKVKNDVADNTLATSNNKKTKKLVDDNKDRITEKPNQHREGYLSGLDYTIGDYVVKMHNDDKTLDNNLNNPVEKQDALKQGIQNTQMQQEMVPPTAETALQTKTIDPVQSTQTISGRTMRR